jgi:hypothetical protein
VALDGDAPFPFQIHVVEQLRLHVPFSDGIGKLEKAVCQRAFTVINMGDYAKIPDVLHSVIQYLVKIARK